MWVGGKHLCPATGAAVVKSIDVHTMGESSGQWSVGCCSGQEGRVNRRERGGKEREDPVGCGRQGKREAGKGEGRDMMAVCGKQKLLEYFI